MISSIIIIKSRETELYSKIETNVKLDSLKEQKRLKAVSVF
jgi:hypothetical protein